MAKVNGPLLSFGGSGQIGKAAVFGSWRGINYARQYVTPANPRTEAQQANRTRFALLREMWKLAPAALRAPWDAFASGRPFLPFNKFVGENNRLLNGETDFATAIMSPGARGGLPPIAVAAATGAGAGEIDITVTPPTTLPEGWTIVEVAAAAFPQQDPVGLFTGPLQAGTSADPQAAITLGGFGPAEPIACFGWVVYSKPDGRLAYSGSLYDTATTPV